ncbi:MAG: hypothetical protein Q4Q62_05455 [Thermoplasmata archaeon]|nr:hypothetical protein [Thermoplasmata archaeon]
MNGNTHDVTRRGADGSALYSENECYTAPLRRYDAAGMRGVVMHSYSKRSSDVALASAGVPAPDAGLADG